MLFVVLLLTDWARRQEPNPWDGLPAKGPCLEPMAEPDPPPAVSSAPSRRDAHMTAAYVFSFSALPSCIFPYASRELRWTPTTPTPPA